MIPLRIASSTLPIASPLVLRLRCTPEPDARTALGHDAYLVSQSGGIAEFDVEGLSLRIQIADAPSLDGDIVLAVPKRRSIQRIIRSRSRHNTLLITEQCDQLCVMCSQPPKDGHVDLFDEYQQALLLSPENAMIGISGGEPLLHKDRLFAMLLTIKDRRPDLRFHVLTNAQHFQRSDMGVVEQLGPDRVQWGIPLYAAESGLHDQIVVKQGAFATLQKSLAMLGQNGARIELRTVLLKSNVNELEALAFYIARHLPFIDFWAIMQLENIGFGRMNWDREFFDHSATFLPIGSAVDTAAAFGTRARLYNFPFCTVPKHYQDLAVTSISDWKNKYLATCDGCSAMGRCAGFFEWHPEFGGYERLEPQ